MKKILTRSLIALLIVLSLTVVVGLAVSAADNSVPAGTPGIVAYATVNGQTKYYTDFNKLVKDASGTSANDRWKVCEITICAEEVTMNNPLVISGTVKIKAAAGVTPTVKVNTTENYNDIEYRGAFVTASAANKLEIEGVDFVVTTNTGADGKGALVQMNSTTESVALAPGQKCELIFNDVNVTSSECIISQYTPTGAEMGRYEITVNGGTWTANNGKGDFIYVPGSIKGEKLMFTFSTTDATFNVAKLYNGPSDGCFAYSLKNPIDDYKAANPGAAELNISNQFVLVYDSDAYFKDNVNGTSNYFSYYPRLAAEDLKTKLAGLGVNIGTRGDNDAASDKEILVGIVDRSVQSEYLSKIKANEYGIFVTENKIILLAWNDAALRVCVNAFSNYISSNPLSLPVGFEFIGVAKFDWKVDFATPSNTTLSASQYLNDNSLQLVYTGTGATNAGYKTYCEGLVSNGYALVWTNTIGNNEFRMYKNVATDTLLYVAYNDYTYSADFEEEYIANYDAATNAYLPTSFTKCIRIVSAPLSTAVLPDEVITEQSYTKITDTYVSTIGIPGGAVGTGHVIMLEDGRFILVDGGNCTCPDFAKDTWCGHVDLVWSTMEKLYKKAHGHEPTEQEPIEVAAWYLTHAHGDHYANFYKMIRLIDGDAAKKSIFKLDYMVLNIPGKDSILDNTSTTWGFSKNFANLQTFLGGIEIIKPYAGQKLHFANLTIEVLMTYGDHLPNKVVNSNDTNTVTRFHITSGENSTSIMFLGDSWRFSSRLLCAMYGSYLKSDISQIAHHGNIGSEKELYDAIAPTGVLFNNTLPMFKDYCWGSATGSNPEKYHAYSVDKYVVREMASVNYVITAVEGKVPTIKFTSGGAQYDAAFNLVDGTAIDYVDENTSLSSQTGFIRKGVTNYHEHSYAFVDFDSTVHTQACECGVIKTGTHAFAPDDNDCTTEAVCLVCEYVIVPAKTAHERGADDNDCTTPVTCKYCRYIFVPAKSHTPGADDNDCTTPTMCTDCGSVAIAAKNHTPAADDGDCTTAIKCAVCGLEAVAAKNHTPVADDGDCTTATVCADCGCVMVAAKNHTPEADDSDCMTATKCTECGKVVVAARNHSPEADDDDCTTEVKCLECGCVVVEATEHELDESGTFCEACGMTFEPEPADTEPVATTTPAATEKKGCKGTLSGVSIALIASLGACAIFAEKKRK